MLARWRALLSSIKEADLPPTHPSILLRYFLLPVDRLKEAERSSKMAAMAFSSRDNCFKHRSRTRTTNWGDVETFQLIELWQSFRYDLQQTKKRRPIFEQMSRIMQGFGFKRDANEIQGRITNLAYLYR